jgi:AmmeMemoRadiSam system protein B
MIRRPAVAGQFYPGSPALLRRTIEAFLDRHAKPFEAKAILSPHAGYTYSGAVAGAVYSSVRLPKRLIVLGPNHTGAGVSLSLYPAGEWMTPIGSAAIDAELNRRLLKECSSLREDLAAHQREHSLEVQIPFIQALVPQFMFSAICVGSTRYEDLDSLGHAMARAVRDLNEAVLIVASSDMTHYEPVEVASRKDKLAIERMIAIDPPGLYRVVIEHDITMCGFAPAVAALTACRDLGATSARLIRYANSGDVSGDRGSVVGYAGLVIN